MFKKILLLLILLILIFPNVNAAHEWNVEHEFYPVDFLFCYNDHNTTEYEGDLGLDDAFCNNQLDNKTYRLSTGSVRAIAYATNKSFRFNESIIMTHSAGKEPKLILTLKYKNGVEIPKLDYDSKSLTKEQLSYFDDYYNQKQIYDDNRAYWQQADLEDTISRSSDKNSQKNSFHRYVGTNGYGYVIDY